jgi:flagellar motor switch protein FliN/FliY
MTPLEQIGHLADIPVYLDVELGRKNMTMGQILLLDNGSVIKMDRPAGDNVDILVGGAAVGSGEIVMIEETVGVRITGFNEED